MGTLHTTGSAGTAGTGPFVQAMARRQRRLGLTGRDYAKLLDISPAQLSRLVTGDLQPSMPLVLRAVREHQPLARYVYPQVLHMAFGSCGPCGPIAGVDEDEDVPPTSTPAH